MHLGLETAPRLFSRCSFSKGNRFLGNMSRWKGATLLVACFYLQFICLPAYHSSLLCPSAHNMLSNQLKRLAYQRKMVSSVFANSAFFGILSGDFGGNIYIILKGHHSLRQPYGLIISLIVSIPYFFTNRKKVFWEKSNLNHTFTFFFETGDTSLTGTQKHLDTYVQLRL